MAAKFLNSKADTPDHQEAEAPGQHRPDAQPQRLLLPLLGPARMADGVDDGQGGEQSEDDGTAMAVRVPTRPIRTKASRGSVMAEVVYGPLEPVGPAVDSGRDDSG